MGLQPEESAQAEGGKRRALLGPGPAFMAPEEAGKREVDFFLLVSESLKFGAKHTCKQDHF